MDLTVVFNRSVLFGTNNLLDALGTDYTQVHSHSLILHDR